MVYTKDIVIEHMRFKYGISKRQAEVLYESYKSSGELNVLFEVVFRPSKEFDI